MSLEAWGTVEQLYHSRAEEVSEHRPLHTGDVVDDIPIPGVQEAGPGIIVAHPCSMRAGPKLADKVLMASVRPHEPVPQHKWTLGTSIECRYRNWRVPGLRSTPLGSARSALRTQSESSPPNGSLV